MTFFEFLAHSDMVEEEEEKSKKHIQNSCLTSQNIIILVPNKKYTERSFPFFSFFLPHSPCLSVLKDFLCIFFLVYANNLANCALNKTAELFLHTVKVGHEEE